MSLKERTGDYSPTINMGLKEDLSDKKILIWGFGREGISTLNFIRNNCTGTTVEIADERQIDKPEGVERVIVVPHGMHPALSGYDYVIKTPGIPLSGLSPEESAVLTSQTQLFMQNYRDQIIGITGTKGKSTTSSLMAHILKKCGRDAILVGNIGLPCFDFADRITPDTVIVFELSCHQLEQLNISPRTAVFLNLYPDHLDHYGTFERYAAAKLHILSYQLPGDRVVVGEQVFMRMGVDVAKSCGNLWRTIQIDACLTANDNASEEHEASDEMDAIREYLPEVGLRVSGRTICRNADAASEEEREEFELEESATKLPGLHNVYNISVVYHICRRYYGIGREEFLAALARFEGLPHRLCNVGTFEGVTYYDDSISTVCETAIQAVHSVANAATLIVGGMDRGIDYNELADFLADCSLKTVLLLPDTGKRIAGLVEARRTAAGTVNGPELVFCENMEDAVGKAARMTPAGKACILSPAAASYGFYKNFEERGDDYVAKIRKFYGVTIA